VLVDRNLDGVIKHLDYGESLPAVGGIRPGTTDFLSPEFVLGGILLCPPGGQADVPQYPQLEITCELRRTTPLVSAAGGPGFFASRQLDSRPGRFARSPAQKRNSLRARAHPTRRLDIR